MFMMELEFEFGFREGIGIDQRENQGEYVWQKGFYERRCGKKKVRSVCLEYCEVVGRGEEKRDVQVYVFYQCFQVIGY